MFLNTVDAFIKEETTWPLVQKSKRHHSLNFKSQVFLNKVCCHFSDAISTFRISRATLSKISDKVETREFYSSNYTTGVDKRKGKAPLLAIGKSLYMSISVLHGKADLQNKEKKSNQSKPKIKLLIWN
ncbi:hypothetical protein C1H46_039483 [Malus baccata]|uniref:Uncharacterized protein n=1 Tax=Malus baccata TaxID=106549 RepID=A0A540KLA9_MALBA|nr:hypothetical protein C1H46_039483 [Malus baccata]